MNKEANGSAGVSRAGVWRPAEPVPKRQRTGPLQNLSAPRPSSVNAKRLGLRRPSAAFLLHRKKAWLAPKNPTPSQSVAVSRTDFAGAAFADGSHGGLAQAGGQIASKYFNMNSLQFNPYQSVSKSVKVNQTSLVRRNCIGVPFLLSLSAIVATATGDVFTISAFPFPTQLCRITLQA